MIEQERFEAWLFQRPDTEQFSYYSCSNCLTARFLREQYPNDWYVVYHDTYSTLRQMIELPVWLKKVLHHRSIRTVGTVDKSPVTMATAKAVYIEVHGDPAKVKGETNEPSTKSFVPLGVRPNQQGLFQSA